RRPRRRRRNHPDPPPHRLLQLVGLARHRLPSRRRIDLLPAGSAVEEAAQGTPRPSAVDRPAAEAAAPDPRHGRARLRRRRRRRIEHLPEVPVEEARRRRSEEHTSELQSRFDLVCPSLYSLSLHDALPIYAESIYYRRGLLSKKLRKARLDRVQSIDLQQKLLPRILGMAELVFDVAGGAGSNISLKYLSKKRAE